MASTKNEASPSMDYRGAYPNGCSVDDVLWFSSMVLDKRLEEERRSLGMPLNDVALWKLLNLGLMDMIKADKPWDSSTRFMHYTATIGDRLWSILERETARVSVVFFNS